ncbi:DUF2339 domain-containing protein [Roseomonas elaeocarpi]|uniref:Glycosyltransferase RgtA/B/C/D-like domain-containing protein n=1 Tax=Roseomonas elaeocarpi TaxID=907779 RepID=A0ABV6JUB6_9PROT
MMKTPPPPPTSSIVADAVPDTLRDGAAPALPRLGLAWRAWLIRLATHLPAVLFLATVLSPPLNHDVAAVLNFSERWLAGEHLYTELIDVNPPLIFVLNLVPAAIAAWTPIGSVAALQLCLVALAGLSLWLCARLRRDRVEGVAEAAVLSALLPLAAVVSGYDFGQREVLMATLALPYAILAARRADGVPTAPRLRLGVAVIAALGFALKPHFLAVPALVEAALLLRQGPRRGFRDPVPWVMAGVWLLYLLSIPVLFPAYLGYVVPLVWQYYLDQGGQSLWQVLLTPQMGAATVLLALLLPFALRREAGNLSLVLALSATGAFASAWVQHKGWTYHVAPILMLGGVLAGLLAARWVDRNLPPAGARRAAPVLGLVAAAALGFVAVRGGEAPFREIQFADTKAGRLTAWLRGEAYGERLLILSPDIFPVYPALNYAQAQSTLRTMNMWLLQGVYRSCPADGERYRQPWEMSRAEFFVYRTVAEDFAKAPPAAVLIDRNPGIPWCGREFDFVEYFSRHPLFAATWRHYHQQGEIEGYRLFVRDD